MRLTHLADELGISDRTARRAAALGLIRGARSTPRDFLVFRGEAEYLRENWAWLEPARRAVRRLPGVSFAAVWRAAAASQTRDPDRIDLVVASAVPQLGPLQIRLSRALGRPVTMTPLPWVLDQPAAIVELVDHGRVLVDLADHWRRLKRARPAARMRIGPPKPPETRWP